MNWRFIAFVLVLTMILFVASLYLANRTLTLWPAAGRHPKIIFGIVATFLLLELVWPFASRAWPELGDKAVFLHWIAYIGLGLFGTILLLAAPLDIIGSILTRITPAISKAAPVAFWFVAITSLAANGIGLLQALREPIIRTIDVPIKNLPPELNGFRIAQITDLHVGPLIGAKRAEKTTELVNKLNPDLIVLTGDLVDGSTEKLQASIAPLKNLRAKHGVYFVTGNHEYYSGAKEWIEHLSQLGFKSLLNSHTIIEHNKKKLVLAGIPDISGGQFIPGHKVNFESTFKDAPTNTPRVLLAHQPAGTSKLIKATNNSHDINLVLSGHTHGGQFYPWAFIVQLAQAHYRGLSKDGNTAFYTSPGAGFWGPPNRFLA